MPTNWPEACCAIIPCLNEADTIGEVISAVRKHLPTVLVVDDGSGDETTARAAAAGARVLRHSTNLGKGAALRTGWQEALRCGFAWALMLDGDGQHHAGDIPRFFDCAEKTEAQLIIGNRMGDTRSMPWPRRRVNQWMSKRLSRTAGMELPDTQCGFRLAKLQTLSFTQTTTQRFEVESEILLNFVRAGQRVEFVPVHTIYKTGRSKIDPLADTWRWFRWFFRQRHECEPVSLHLPRLKHHSRAVIQPHL